MIVRFYNFSFWPTPHLYYLLFLTFSLSLHSTILSGGIADSRTLACFDIFPNINRIGCVAKFSPLYLVLVIHREEDREVAFTHGHRWYLAVPESSRASP
jgi:hypothetical protein